MSFCTAGGQGAEFWPKRRAFFFAQARDTHTGSHVAVKTMELDEITPERLRREVRPLQLTRRSPPF